MNEKRNTEASQVARILVAVGLTRRASVMFFGYALFFATLVTAFVLPGIRNHPENATMIIGYFILPLGVVLLLSGWLVFGPKWNAQLTAAQRCEATGRADRSESGGRKLWRGLQAAMACWGSHLGISIVAVLVLVVTGTMEQGFSVLQTYMMLGWIPLAIVLFPVFYRKLN